MTARERLAAAGMHLPDELVRLGRYVPGVRVDRLVFVSGQTGTENGQPVWVGRLGAELGVDDARRSARLAALNSLAALEATVGDLESVRAIVRLTVYVCATPTFPDHPEIADAVTEVFEAAFGEAGRGARSAIGVASLPQGAPVEIDVIASVADERDG